MSISSGDDSDSMPDPITDHDAPTTATSTAKKFIPLLDLDETSHEELVEVSSSRKNEATYNKKQKTRHGGTNQKSANIIITQDQFEKIMK